VRQLVVREISDSSRLHSTPKKVPDKESPGYSTLRRRRSRIRRVQATPLYAEEGPGQGESGLLHLSHSERDSGNRSRLCGPQLDSLAYVEHSKTRNKCHQGCNQ
jgi:hypothetical protein